MMKIFKKKQEAISNAVSQPNGEIIVEKSVKEQTKDLLQELKSSQDIAIQKIVDSHLLLLESLDDYSLYLPCVDQVLQNLQDGLDEAVDENQKKLLRKQSTVIIGSLLLKMQAQFLSFKKQTRSEAQAILRFSDQQYVTAVVSTLSYASLSKEVIKQGTAKLTTMIAEQKENGVESYLLFDSVKLMTRYLSKKKDYFNTFNEMFEKFYRNRNLLGDSLALSEYIHNHEKDLTAFYIRGYKWRSRFWKIFAVVFTIVATIILLYSLLFSSLLSLFTDTEELKNTNFLYNELIILVIALSPILYYKIKYMIMKYRILKKYHKIADALSPTQN